MAFAQQELRSMNRITTKIALLMIAAMAASGCGVFKKGPPKTPVLGERVAVLTTENDVAVDPATAALPMVLPAPVANSEWAQSGGNAAKSMGHLALGSALGRAFTVSIGYGSTLTARLASPPVVDNGRVYTTDGLGFVAALDVRNGGVLWQVRPGGPLRGAPTVSGDTLYVISQDNQIYSLKTSDGTTNWSNAAALEIAGVFGTGSPAVAQGTVVAGFSSGELNAYRYENGRLVWQDALARTSIRTSVASLSDIDANAVIDNGQVFAIGQGGRMVALELNSGQRMWELNIAGIATPWVAGDWVFVATDDAKLIAVARASGKVRWINQMPRFQREKSKRGQITYRGPVLAGGRLVLVGSNGTLINFDPATGNSQSQTSIGARVTLAPVVANSTLYVLDDEGRLHAFR